MIYALFATKKKNKTSGDKCTHTFCYECILSWCKIKNVCPLCKAVIMNLVPGV